MKIADEASDAYYCWPSLKKLNSSISSDLNGDIEMGSSGSMIFLLFLFVFHLFFDLAVDADITDACKASHAHEFISQFPHGYNTDVGEGSIMVSGGQKQRIAIARALIKKPAVLLLDEATSALDANSERIVQESIDALQQLKAQTTIVIAHRLSTIRNADKIVVVDKGAVVEVGTHDQLIARADGLYAQLWAKQSGGDGNSSPIRRNQSSKRALNEGSEGQV
jgi:ABC-type protease/lipase transport system fused ATPase/permease subunit